MSFSAGVIAAGEGSRLAAAYKNTIKPLVPVAGRPLSHWVVGALAAAGAESATILTNSRGRALEPSLRSAFPRLAMDFLTADTASSFDSFRLVCLALAERREDFLVSTVDAIVPADDVARFLRECRAGGVDAGLALTARIDDEKPLWAEADARGRVVALGGEARRRELATVGLYYMTRAEARLLPAAGAHARLRDYWSSLIKRGAAVAGPRLSATWDVDRPEDVVSAESLLENPIERARIESMSGDRI